MTDEILDPRFERDLRAVLDDLAPADAPPALYDFVAAVPAGKPAARRAAFGGRRPFLLLAAAAAVVIAVVAIASALQPRGDLPAVGGDVTPAPSGALYLEYEVLPVDRLRPSITDIQQIQDQLGARLRAAGLAEFRIGLTTEEDHITVDVPALPTDPAVAAEIRALLGATGRVDIVPLGRAPAAPGDTVDLAITPPLASGDEVVSAAVAADQDGTRTLDLTLGTDATARFATWTADHIGDFIAIAMDGVVITVPTIMSQIPDGQVQISGVAAGGWPETEVQRLAAIIDAGELAFPLREVTPEPVGP